MRQGGGAGGSALSIWVRALAEGGEAAGEIKSDAAGHQSDWASGKITIVVFRSASGIAPPVPRRNVSQTGRVRLSAETANRVTSERSELSPAPEFMETSQRWELSQPPRSDAPALSRGTPRGSAHCSLRQGGAEARTA